MLWLLLKVMDFISNLFSADAWVVVWLIGTILCKLAGTKLFFFAKLCLSFVVAHWLCGIAVEIVPIWFQNIFSLAVILLVIYTVRLLMEK